MQRAEQSKESMRGNGEAALVNAERWENKNLREEQIPFREIGEQGKNVETPQKRVSTRLKSKGNK